MKVQQFKPYFLSEVDLADFETEYLEKLHDKIFEALNAQFKSGFELPLGADLNLLNEDLKVTVQKDYILAEAKRNKAEGKDQSHRFSRFSKYEPEKDAQQRRKYPVTWVVDQNHQVEMGSVNDGNGSYDQTCTGKACRDSDASSELSGRVDEL